jgi:alkanesulfonate monooxygenase SsuD/methylene tetrahydromethanopterin reductase-like flavin-dependent oxidoreductase (luciferase family)
VDFGLGLLGYDGSWEDARFAEGHGFATAGWVDSPLLGGDPFVCLGLAAHATTRMRIGTFLAIPGLRSAPTTAAAIATVNKLAAGRTFLGVGTGFTGRQVFGLPRLPAARMRDFALECRALLDGEEVEHAWDGRRTPVRLRHAGEIYVDTRDIPVYVAADGPKALAAAGAAGDGWVVTLQYSHLMQTGHEVFAASLAAVRDAARAAGREGFEPYTMLSAVTCILDEGESAVSERALAQAGPGAMLAFHAWACDRSIGPYLPPFIQDRLEIFQRAVLDRFDVTPDRVFQEVHRGHLSHLLPGEEEVLTEEIMRATTLTGTAQEIAGTLSRLQDAGLHNVSFWVPPEHTRDVVLALARKVKPATASE